MPIRVDGVGDIAQDRIAVRRWDQAEPLGEEGFADERGLEEFVAAGEGDLPAEFFDANRGQPRGPGQRGEARRGDQRALELGDAWGDRFEHSVGAQGFVEDIVELGEAGGQGNSEEHRGAGRADARELAQGLLDLAKGQQSVEANAGSEDARGVGDIADALLDEEDAVLGVVALGAFSSDVEHRVVAVHRDDARALFEHAEQLEGEKAAAGFGDQDGSRFLGRDEIAGGLEDRLGPQLLDHSFVGARLFEGIFRGFGHSVKCS